jgi:HEAT repeat protein
MDNRDPEIRPVAARALADIGAEAVPALLAALQSSRAYIRLGAIEALSGIRDPSTVRHLLSFPYNEKHVELRSAAVLALGEIGSPEAVPHLVQLLGDESKHIRYAAAISLGRLGWIPSAAHDHFRYLIARCDWEGVREGGPDAVQPLREIFRDSDPKIRSRIASLLGEFGVREGSSVCRAGLRDRDPGVRWSAVLAAMDCGIKPACMPLFIASRERTGPNPFAAAILNFLFLGLGYNYIGKWWGFPVFMVYMSILVLAQLATGPFIPYFVAYPVTAIFGAHTYYLARRMSDL